MGESQVALTDPVYINLKNPASFARLEDPTFAVDFNMNWLTIETPSATQQQSTQYINGFAFGFPMGKRFGAAFSLGPYTKIGYDLTAPQESPVLGRYDFRYTGEGGYNHATGGFGGSPILNDSNELSIGVQIGYFFGFSQTSRSVTNFLDNANVTSSKMINRTNINDVGLSFGLTYKRRIAEETWLSIGGSIRPSTNISSQNQQLSYTYRPSGLNDNIVDTVQDINQKGDLKLPDELAAGLALQISDNWLISGEYSSTAWSQLELNGTPFSLSDANAISGGIQYVANTAAVAKFFQSVRYRGGFRYENTRLNFGGNQLTQISGTAGIGIPFQKTKMRTTFNFGIEIGSRGQDGKTLVKENFTNLFIGLSMNPHKFDGWFKRSKYN